MSFIRNFLVVLAHKIQGKKTDFFLSFKYNRLAKYYGNKCLDVGAGTGRFSKFLTEQNHAVQPIDIVNRCEFKDLKFKIFNGKDTSLLMFVLHHTDEQSALIDECKRVTKNYLIIAEDIIQNRLDKILGRLHLGTSPWSKSQNGFKTREGWAQFFEEHQLEIIETVEIPRKSYPVYPVTREIYVLKKIN